MSSSVYTHHTQTGPITDQVSPLIINNNNYNIPSEHISRICITWLMSDEDCFAPNSCSSAALTLWNVVCGYIISLPESHLETEDGESSVGERSVHVYSASFTEQMYNVNGKQKVLLFLNYSMFVYLESQQMERTEFKFNVHCHYFSQLRVFICMFYIYKPL